MVSVSKFVKALLWFVVLIAATIMVASGIWDEGESLLMVNLVIAAMVPSLASAAVSIWREWNTTAPC